MIQPHTGEARSHQDCHRPIEFLEETMPVRQALFEVGHSLRRLALSLLAELHGNLDQAFERALRALAPHDKRIKVGFSTQRERSVQHHKESFPSA